MLKGSWQATSDDDDTPIPLKKNRKPLSESDDDDTPIQLKKNRKPLSESDDDDTPIRLKKKSKSHSEPDDASDSSSSEDKSEDSSDDISIDKLTLLDKKQRSKTRALNNTKSKLQGMKHNFFDLCLEQFEQDETAAIAFFVSSMKESIKVNEEMAALTHKIASIAENKISLQAAIDKKESSQRSDHFLTWGVRQQAARRNIVRMQAEHFKKYGELGFKK